MTLTSLMLVLPIVAAQSVVPPGGPGARGDTEGRAPRMPGGRRRNGYGCVPSSSARPALRLFSRP